MSVNPEQANPQNKIGAEEGAMKVINVDESREKEKDKYVKECVVRLDNPWKVVFCHALCKKRPNAHDRGACYHYFG